MRTFVIPFVLVCSGRLAHAQYAAPPDPTGVCVANCGGSTTSSGTDPQMAAAIAAEKAERARIDQENAARMSAAQRVHNFRVANSDGVSAYSKKQWAAAIRHFERALAIYPDDYQTRSNLEAAQRAQADDTARRERELAAKRRADELEKYRQAHAAEQKRLAKKLANGPEVPPPGTGPSIRVGTKLDDSQPPAIRESRELIQSTLEAVGDRAKDEALGHLEEMIDLYTPQGQFIRKQMNITKLATDVIPRMLMAAAKGEIQPGAPLTEYAVTVLYDVDNVADRARDAATNGLFQEVERARTVIERWTTTPETAK